MKKFHFGKNLQKIRESKGLTQTEMGFLVHMSQSQYSRFEARADTPRPSMLQALAKALKVEEEHLLTHVNEPLSSTISESEDRGLAFVEEQKSINRTIGVIVCLIGAGILPQPVFTFFYTLTWEHGYREYAEGIGFLAGAIVVGICIHYALKIKNGKIGKKKKDEKS